VLLSCRDPGNWATGLAGGAQFGYSLLFVILLSSIAAMFLQHLALKLGVASGRDLAQACRDAYPRWAWLHVIMLSFCCKACIWCKACIFLFLKKCSMVYVQ
jgi:NRAMP (natural resistance-associated macrophage protein)-like metal ion transporter